LGELKKIEEFYCGKLQDIKGHYESLIKIYNDKLNNDENKTENSSDRLIEIGEDSYSVEIKSESNS